MAVLGSSAALACSFIEYDGAGGGDVQGTDPAGHGDAEQMVAGAADEVVEAGAFASEDEHAVAGEIEPVVAGGAAFVESDDPEVLALKFFEGADEVDDAGDAEMFGGACAGFDGYGAEGSRAAFGEEHAVDACSIGDAEKRAKVLRVLYAVESEKQAGSERRGRWRLKQVFKSEEGLGTDESDDALMGRGSGALGELLAQLGAHGDTGLTAGGDDAGEALVVALASDQNMVDAAAAGLEGLFDGMEAVENFHEVSLDCR